MHHTPETVLLHIQLIDGLGSGIAKRILSCLSPEQLPQIYEFGTSELIHRCQLPAPVAQRLYAELQDTTALERELLLLIKHNISWISLISPHFPPLLKEIHAPPIGIYVLGQIPASQSSLAVVGSRDANDYGLRVIQRIVPDLCAQGVVIVSGGAFGIDMMAHEAAVAARSATIAVMGCGLLQITRRDNLRLFPKIIENGGAIVSSFPLMMDAQPGHFPARNRIISGLSQGCLVVQAAKKSGALITANFALEQGREVFAVPGPIDDLISAGCNNLLRQGATLVETAEDITGMIPVFTSKPAQMTIGSQEQLVLEVSETSECNKSQEGGSLECRLVSLCVKPTSVDDLSNALGLELFEVQARLFELQMAGRLQQNYAGLWHI